MPPDGGGKFPRLSFISESGVTENIRHKRVTNLTDQFQIARIATSSGLPNRSPGTLSYAYSAPRVSKCTQNG